MWDQFVRCVKSFVSERDGGFITRNNFRNGERTEPAYSRSFNPLLKNRSYPRHGMRVGSNGRNSSRSSQPVERETMCCRWKIASRKNENARNELPRSFEIIGSRHAGRAKGASRYRHETIAINQTPCILLRRFKFPPGETPDDDDDDDVACVTHRNLRRLISVNCQRLGERLITANLFSSLARTCIHANTNTTSAHVRGERSRKCVTSAGSLESAGSEKQTCSKNLSI